LPDVRSSVYPTAQLQWSQSSFSGYSTRSLTTYQSSTPRETGQRAKARGLKGKPGAQRSKPSQPQPQTRLPRDAVHWTGEISGPNSRPVFMPCPCTLHAWYFQRLKKEHPPSPIRKVSSCAFPSIPEPTYKPTYIPT
jgi:hypothetical protein